VDDCLGNGSTEFGHSFSKPGRNPSAVKGKVCDTGTLHDFA